MDSMVPVPGRCPAAGHRSPTGGPPGGTPPACHRSAFLCAERIEVLDRRDTDDTPENRFVKYALELFLQTLEDLQQRLAATQSGKFPGVLGETEELIEGLEETLSHSVFKEVARPEVLPLNSPVLQRKEGYRQVYRAWMLFELAARLSWEGVRMSTPGVVGMPQRSMSIGCFSGCWIWWRSSLNWRKNRWRT